jgi:hypothetical protein
MSEADNGEKVQRPSGPPPDRIEKRGGQTAPPNAPTPSRVTWEPHTSLVPPPAAAPDSAPASAPPPPSQSESE